MSDPIHEATLAAMGRQGCEPVEVRQGFPTPDIWLGCCWHNAPWDQHRDECSVIAAVVRIGFEAGRRDALTAAARVIEIYSGDIDRSADVLREIRSLSTTETETSHEFLPVRGHPDDDECTYRADGTDLTYCGRPAHEHEETNDA